MCRPPTTTTPPPPPEVGSAAERRRRRTDKAELTESAEVSTGGVLMTSSTDDVDDNVDVVDVIDVSESMDEGWRGGATVVEIEKDGRC